MRFRLTFLLLALNAALLGAIFYFEKIDSTDSLLEQSQRLILDPDFVVGLDRIVITGNRTDHQWILQKSDGLWSVASPTEWKANPFAVEQLLFQLLRLSWESRFPVSGLSASGQSLASYQLDSPPIRLDLHNQQSRVSLLLGAPTEIGNRFYIMSPDGDYVHVVPRGLLDSLQRDLEAFLDRRIFTMPVEEVQAIQIQDRGAGSIRVRLERHNGEWRFVSPIQTLADSEEVESFLQTWLGQEVREFVAPGDSQPGLSGNAIRLTLQGFSSRETLILAPEPDEDDAEGIYARREEWPAAFRLQAARVEALRTVQEDLREKRVLKQSSGNWNSLELQFGNRSLTLQRLEGGRWQVLFTDPEGQLQTLPADAGTIAGLDQLFASLEAVRFVTDAPSEADLQRFGLQDPQRRLRIRLTEGDRVEFLIGGLHPDAEQTLLYARTSESDSVFLVRPHVLATLSLDPLHYREKTLQSLSSETAIQQISLIHRSSGLAVPLPESATDDPGVSSPRSILEAYLREVRVERFLDQPFADPLVLDDTRKVEWPWFLEAKITRNGASTETSETLRFHISRRLGGTTQYLGDPSSGLVGTLPARVIEALDPLLARFPNPPPENPPSMETTDEDPDQG
jgi:hypothetical protein